MFKLLHHARRVVVDALYEIVTHSVYDVRERDSLLFLSRFLLIIYIYLPFHLVYNYNLL